MKRFALLLAVVLAACGGSVAQQPDAAPPDIDAAVDAGVDAPPDAAVAPPSAELTGGGRMTGGTFVVDVQIGGPIARTPSSGGSVVLQPNTPIKP